MLIIFTIFYNNYYILLLIYIYIYLLIKNMIKNDDCHFKILSFRSKNLCYDLSTNLNNTAIRTLAITKNITRIIIFLVYKPVS